MSVQDVQNEVKEILSQVAESVRELDFVVHAELKGIGTSVGVLTWTTHRIPLTPIRQARSAVTSACSSPLVRGITQPWRRWVAGAADKRFETTQSEAFDV